MSTGLHFPTYCDEHHDLIRDFGAPRPEIVVLCGSTRFYDEFQRASYDLTMAGAIVLAPGVWVRSSPAFADLPEDRQAEVKRALDELHKRKIDLADRVHVLNVGGYVGESTRSEIAYAEALGKPVEYLEPVAVPDPAPSPGAVLSDLMMSALFCPSNGECDHDGTCDEFQAAEWERIAGEFAAATSGVGQSAKIGPGWAAIGPRTAVEASPVGRDTPEPSTASAAGAAVEAGRRPTPEVVDLLSNLRRWATRFDTGQWTDADLRFLADFDDWWEATGKDLARQRSEAPALLPDGDMLARLGTDGAAWAAEFQCRYPGIDPLAAEPGSHLHGWFANAIEAGRTAGHAEAKRDEVSRGYCGACGRGGAA